jgi:hypothetical protein
MPLSVCVRPRHRMTARRHTLPVEVTNSKEIEVAAAKVFTPSNFYILQEELKKIEGIEISQRNVGTDGVQQFVVSWKEKRKQRFYVEYTPNNFENI